jgi:tetratricopeptide (TPR) repeat protein
MIFRKAERLNERGSELSANGSFAKAEAAYRAAAEARPKWSVPWYNLGLMHKYQGNWEASLECNLRSAELAPSDTASWWNAGIAATALGRWDVARRAWLKCEVHVPPGEGPIEMELGSVPIRLAEGEVVWCRRIDPARAILISVPLPSSGHRWGDLVLHDGAANGYRMLGDRQVPVFDVLECLQPSAFGTFIAELEADDSDLELLSSIAEDLGGAAEDWSTNTRILCKECSEGVVGHRHETDDHTTPAHPRCGIAARDEPHAQEILSAWLARVPNGRALGLRPGAAEPGDINPSGPSAAN